MVSRVEEWQVGICCCARCRNRKLRSISGIVPPDEKHAKNDRDLFPLLPGLLIAAGAVVGVSACWLLLVGDNVFAYRDVAMLTGKDGNGSDVSALDSDLWEISSNEPLARAARA